MLFSKNLPIPGKKYLAIVLLLLITLTLLPTLSVQASVDLLYFRAVPGSDSITLEWATAQELDNLGFNLYRSLTSEFDDAEPLNSALIPGNTGSPTGASYEWVDEEVEIGTTYTYWLEDIDINGVPTLHDPDSATVTGGGSIPTVPSGGNTATPTPSRTPTRTPTATAQSGNSSATETPTNTPVATSSSSNSTATATTPATAQATAETSNTTSATATSQSVSTNSTATPEPDKEDPIATPTNEAAQLPSPTAESILVEAETNPETIAETSTEGDASETTEFSAQQIGEGTNTQEANANPNDSQDSDTNTPILMALIASVVLLFVGGGGVIILLLNRSKQTRT